MNKLSGNSLINHILKEVSYHMQSIVGNIRALVEHLLEYQRGIYWAAKYLCETIRKPLGLAEK